MAAVEVAAGLLTCNGAILACQRPPGGRHPGRWEFPGGKRWRRPDAVRIASAAG